MYSCTTREVIDMTIVVNAFPKDPVVYVIDVCLYFRFTTLIDLMYRPLSSAL